MCLIAQDGSEYLDVLMKALKIIPKNIVIQRLTAGVGDETLIAPIWCKDLRMQRKHLFKRLKKEGYIY